MPTIGDSSGRHPSTRRTRRPQRAPRRPGHEPVSFSVRRGRYPNDGFVQRRASHHPSDAPIPNENTPPSEATERYPFPSGVAAIPTMGLFSRRASHRSVERGPTD